MPQTIVAVAIGSQYKPVPINSVVPNGVRKYINGFVAAFPHTLGTDYVIDYRECPGAQLGSLVFTNQLQADYIICMSTPVVRQAAKTYPETTNKPIIGMVSRWQKEPFHNQKNVCGVSAARSDDAHDVYGHLLDIVSPALITATVLNDPNHSPSVDSKNDILKHIPHGAPQPNFIDVNNLNDVQNAIKAAKAKSGMLLLPVDWMFGDAPTIIGSALNSGVLDFWFVTDWVQQAPAQSAFGGYGVSQETCGHYLAQQVDAIWTGGWPNPNWLQVHQRDWKASQTRATNANVQLNSKNPPNDLVIVP